MVRVERVREVEEGVGGEEWIESGRGKRVLVVKSGGSQGGGRWCWC